MTSKEILQADLLDILFEHRNKAYGAYALRKSYAQRLQWALVISLSLTVFLLKANFQNAHSNKINRGRMTDVFISKIEIPENKPKIPQSTPHNSRHVVAQVPNTPIIIVSNDLVKQPEVPTLNDLNNAVTSTISRTGIPPDGIEHDGNAGNNQNKDSGETSLTSEFHPLSSEAQFPGGINGFRNFLTKYLNTPSDLEAGEKKTVLVRFMVGEDGAISGTEILQSGGEEYDKEVIRVLRKMPKWIPALQNGVRVVSWFTQPVTFIGLEQ